MARIAQILSLYCNILPGAHALWRQCARDGGPLAIALGLWAGGLYYFLSPITPNLVWAGLPLGLGLIALAWRPVRLAGVMALAFAGMVLWAGAWMHLTPRPLWATAPGQSLWVVGQLQEVRPQAHNPKRVTLTLSPVHVLGLPPHSQPPKTVRLGVWATQAQGMLAGQYVAAPAEFLPPAGPQLPHQRDTRLWRWVQAEDLGAFTTGTAEITADGARYVPQKKAAQTPLPFTYVEAWRAVIVSRTQHLGQGVPTALLVGEQAGISPEVRQAYQGAGISHLLAISGMQLTLVGLGAFALLRWILASWPLLALRAPIKVWAACGALGVVGGYTLLTGAGPSIVRAAVMVGMVLVAVLAGRVRGLVRAWAIANGLILLVQPHWAISAGLQLSAAATLALALWAPHAPRPQGLWGWLKASLWATILAGAATAPIALLQFGSLAPLGVLGNLLAIPLMSAASYMAFMALALWPLGLEALPMAPLVWLSNLTTRWAESVAALQPPLWQGYSTWLPLVCAGVAMLVLCGMAARKPAFVLGVTAVSVLGFMALGRVAAPPVLVVAENGTAAWRVLAGPVGPQYRLIWAENPAEAGRLGARLGVQVLATQPPACCAEPTLMPPTGPFAYATLYANGQWVAKPLACARPWQAPSASCAE